MAVAGCHNPILFQLFSAKRELDKIRMEYKNTVMAGGEDEE